MIFSELPLSGGSDFFCDSGGSSYIEIGDKIKKITTFAENEPIKTKDMRNITKILSMLAVALFAFVACDKPEVNEPQPEPKFELTSEARVDIAAEGGEVAVTYALQNPIKGVEVVATADANWLTQSAMEQGRVVYTAVANEDYEARTATITLAYDKYEIAVEVVQEAAVKPATPVIVLEKSVVEVPAEGGTYSIGYTIENPIEGVEFGYITTDEGWFGTIEITESAILLEIVPNDDVDERTKSFSLTYGDVTAGLTIKQAGVVVELDLAATEVEAAASGGDYYVAYTITNPVANAALEVTAIESWLRATANDTEITIAVEENTTYEPRTATLYVDYANVSREITVTQLAKLREESLTIASVALGNHAEGSMELIFTTDNGTKHLFNVVATLTEGVIPDGYYSMVGGTMTRGIHSYNRDNGEMVDASLDALTRDGQTRFDISWKYDNVIYMAEWTGVVEGFDYNFNIGGGDTIPYDIIRAEVAYDKVGEKEIVFYYNNFAGHKFNFKRADIAVGKPVADGVYSTEDGSMSLSYCKHGYGDEYGQMTSAKAVVKNNGDKTTTFRIEWEYSNNVYSLVWTGAVEGYNYEDVAGTKLPFTPTFVEVAITGAAGTYFYFYDDANNELVFNYDKGHIYMPYINFEGLRMEINTEEYKFEYVDNKDYTYTYDARFVTLDGRIIEFAGTIFTEVTK